MILAVFFFFVLVGLFFLAIEFRDVKKGAEELRVEQTISSIKVIADMPELNYYGENLAVDEDKLIAMSGVNYEGFWPVVSVKVYKVYPSFKNVIKCPGLNCNYFEIYNSGQKSTKEYSSFVSICRKVKEFGYVYDRCEIGKIVLGVKINE